MTGLVYPGDHGISKNNVFGEPLRYQGELLFSDKVFLVFQGLFSGLVAGAIVRNEKVVFSAGKPEGVEYLRNEFGLDV